MEPSYWQPHYTLAYIYLDQSLLEETAVEAGKAFDLSGGASAALTIIASVEFLAGRTADGNRHLKELLGKAEKKYVPPTFFAWISMARGDQEEAIPPYTEGDRDEGLLA